MLKRFAWSYVIVGLCVLSCATAGADDKAIHDTVLIAAMFSMFNRYVDGLATWTPTDPEFYEETGKRLATKGYGSRFRVVS